MNTATSAAASSTADSELGQRERSFRGQVACVTCRNSKIRCEIQQVDDTFQTCSRCARLKISCVVRTPARRRGGPKTIVAVPNVTLPSTASAAAAAAPASIFNAVSDPTNGPPSTSPALPTSASSLPNPSPSTSFAELPNPLGLLAGASNDATSVAPQTASLRLDEDLGTQCTGADLEGHLPVPNMRVGRGMLRQGLAYVTDNTVFTPSQDEYFSRVDPASNRRDIGVEYDPVSSGVIDADIMPYLFGHFFAEIHPLAPTLDPVLCTCQYARDHSALLLTAVCLVSAQTLPGYAALTLQLQAHAEKLLDKIFTRNLCSVEILQGINVYSTWPRSASRLKDDQQSKWLSVAIGMVLDLRLDSIFNTPAGHFVNSASRAPSPSQSSQAEIEAHRRMQERTYLAIFVWDRNFALATGRSWTFSDATVATAIHNWYRTPNDAHLIDAVSMRLACSRIRTSVSECLQTRSAEAVPKLILEAVSQEIDGWKPHLSVLDIAGCASTWKQAISTNLIYAHTKLWALALGLPYTGTSAESVLLRATCWQTALQACETSVLHADNLLHLPASSAFMNVYGALMLLSLYPFVSSRHDTPKNAIVGLVGQIARYLTRSGTEPSHRNGPNAIYGRHLLAVARQHVPTAATATADAQDAAAADGTQQEGLNLTFGEYVGDGQSDLAIDQFFYPWPLVAAPVTGLTSADQDGGWPVMDWLLEGSPYTS